MTSYLELIQLYPRASIIIIALALNLAITLINYFFIDKERLREIKSKQKDLQKQAREHQKAGNHEKAMEANKEMLSHTMEMMKHSLKPTLITMIPILLLFNFMRGVYAETSLASSWFWYYLITAIFGSMLFRKLFKMP